MVNINILGDMLARKLELMQQFCRQTELMLQALGDEDMQEFNDLLVAREKIINQVNDLDSQMVSSQTVVTGGDTGSDCGLLPGDARQVKDKIQECLLKAQEMDLQMHAFIEKKYEDMTKNTDNVRVARQAEHMYRKKAASSHGYFVDKKK